MSWRVLEPEVIRGWRRDRSEVRIVETLRLIRIRERELRVYLYLYISDEDKMTNERLLNLWMNSLSRMSAVRR